MPEVTRDVFATMCFCKRNAINTYIGRKKINSLPNKNIDTDDELNKLFLQGRKRKHLKKNASVEKPIPIKQSTKPETPTPGVPTEKSKKENKEEDLFINKLGIRKEVAETEAKERESQLKLLTLEKMMGQLMPVDLVHGIIKINIQNVFRSFENELMNLASIYCDIMAAGDRSKLSEVTDLMRENLHRIITETKDNSAKEIKGVIREYSESRGRGERK